MTSKEVRSMVDMIRDADNKDLVIVSLFLLPLLLGAWSLFLNSLDFLDQYPGYKLIIISTLFILYISGLFIMKIKDTEMEKLKRARFHVETRLKKRAGHRASFDAIRDEVNKDYSDVFLRKLIDLNPEIFGTCIIKKGNKPGITLVTVESENIQPNVALDCKP